MASGAGNEAIGAHPGGELTAEEVGEAEFEADCLMGTGSTRAIGGLTEALGEMK